MCCRSNTSSGYNVAVVGSFSDYYHQAPNNSAIFDINDNSTEFASLDSIPYSNVTKQYDDLAEAVAQFPILRLIIDFSDLDRFLGTTVWMNTDQMVTGADNSTMTAVLNAIIDTPSSYYARITSELCIAEGGFQRFLKVG